MIQIYQFPMCPFCARVLFTLDEMGLREGKDYELIEAARGTPGRKALIELGGKSQVPFLVDGKVRMYESADIIAYIRNKFNK